MRAETLVGLALLGVAAFGHRRAILAVERTYGARWGRWRWWTQLPFWAGATLVAGLVGGPGWAALVIVAGSVLAVALLTARSLRGGGRP